MSSVPVERAMPATRGVIFVHACPPALAPHVEWALGSVLTQRVRLQWSAQPYRPGELRAEADWFGPAGMGSLLAAALRPWPMLVFEVSENGTALTDGERLAYLPGRGFHRRMISANGDVMVGEERLRALLSSARDGAELRHGMDELLGASWDEELEPYREGAWGQPVTLLRQVV